MRHLRRLKRGCLFHLYTFLTHFTKRAASEKPGLKVPVVMMPDLKVPGVKVHISDLTFSDAYDEK